MNANVSDFVVLNAAVVFNISKTKSQTLNVSHLVWHLCQHNLLKQGVKSRMKM